MGVTYTTNKSFAEVTVGTESGTWGPYVNTNFGMLDNCFGGSANLALTNANVILSSAQYQCNFINFTGAITANISITFPPVGSFYTIQNLTTNTSNFLVTLKTSVGGSEQIGCPSGEPIDIMTDGTHVRFRNLGRVGSFINFRTAPSWINACSIAPYLACDGSAFSSATYPHLTVLMGGTTLPDLRGRIWANNNSGTGRITAAGGGVDGDTNGAAGGTQAATIGQANLPNVSFPVVVTDPGHTHALQMSNNTAGGATFPANAVNNSGGPVTTDPAVTGISVTVNSGGSGTALQTLPPICIGGVTMVRAA